MYFQRVVTFASYADDVDVILRVGSSAELTALLPCGYRRSRLRHTEDEYGKCVQLRLFRDEWNLMFLSLKQCTALLIPITGLWFLSKSNVRLRL